MSSNMQRQSSELLLDSLKRLASPPETQIAYLDSLGTGGLADELALEFDDSYQAVVAQFTHDPQLLLDLEDLNRHLGSMSGEQHASLWQYEALRTAKEWNTTRSLARKILAQWHS